MLSGGGAPEGITISAHGLGFPIEGRLGSVHIRYSNDSADLIVVQSMICGPFDGVFVITFVCVGQSNGVCIY
jgi:hypothetical protein